MLKKNYEVTIQCGYAMDLVKILGKHGVKFEVSEEYFDELDPAHTWYRDFTIRVNSRTMDAIWSEFKNNVNRVPRGDKRIFKRY